MSVSNLELPIYVIQSKKEVERVRRVMGNSVFSKKSDNMDPKRCRSKSRSKSEAHYEGLIDLRAHWNTLLATDLETIEATVEYVHPHTTSIITHAFLELFAESPDLKDKFVSFRNLDICDLVSQENNDGALDRHAPRLTRVVHKVLQHLRRLDDLDDYLQCLGKIHHKNGITEHEMRTLGPFFVLQAERYMPKALQTVETRESWNMLFVVMADAMSVGYPVRETNMELEERSLIQRSFNILRDHIVDVGRDTFITLFQAHTSSKMFFPVFRDSPLEDLSTNQALKSHSMKLIKVLEHVIADLDNNRALDIYLAQLGQMHQMLGIEARFLDVMGPIFVHTIRPILRAEDAWCLETRQAWLHLFRIVCLRMKRGFKHFVSGPLEQVQEDEERHEKHDDDQPHDAHRGEDCELEEQERNAKYDLENSTTINTSFNRDEKNEIIL